MPQIVPAIPAIGGAVAGWLGGGKPGMDENEKALMQRMLGLTDQQMQMLGDLRGFTQEMQPWASGSLQSTAPWFPMTTSGIEFAEQMGNRGGDFLNMAEGAFTPSMKYFTDVLSGGPEMMMALSPELRATSNAFDQAKRQVSQFAPMGGGRANTLAQLPMQRGAAVSDIISRARPAAASGLANIGTQAGGLGATLTGQRTGLTSSLASNLTGLTGELVNTIGRNYAAGSQGAGSGLQGLLNFETERRNAGERRGTGIGTGVGNILQNIKWRR